jgi:AraC-like DNA-binding protein
MQRFEWISDEFPERERFEMIRTRIIQEMGLRTEVDPADRFAFRAHLGHLLSPGFGRVRSLSDPYAVYRGPSELSHLRYPAVYVIYRQRAGQAWFQIRNQEFTAKPGDLVVSDSALGATSVAQQRVSLEYWRLPKAAVDPYLPARARPAGFHLPQRRGVEALISSLFESLDENIDALPEAAISATLDHICRLVGVACGAAIGEQPGSVAAARLAQAKQAIAKNLADTELSPATVATQLGMSVRRLHALFEPTGETFAQHVQRLRLEACRSMFADGAFAGRSITDIALGWGFGSLPTFYRAFRRAYGIAPGDLREARRALGAPAAE